MPFGHNSSVTISGDTYHVQTEERGAAQALIDTTVYLRGRVLHRRTNSFLDLLPLNADREQALKLRVDTQHRSVVDEIRSGKLRLTVPSDEKTPAARAVASVESAPALLHLELLNAKTWLTGKRALLQIVVQDHANKPVQGAAVTARVEGAAQPAAFSVETGSLGRANLEFEMPSLAGPEVALVIEASKGKARAHLRFQLRAKPRVPSAS
jgi:plasmid stability protein